MSFTAHHLYKWMWTMRTALGRVRRKKKGKSGGKKKKLSDREQFVWDHMQYLNTQIKPRSYIEIITVCIFFYHTSAPSLLLPIIICSNFFSYAPDLIR